MALLDEKVRGVFVISVTPFQDDGSLDLDSLDRVTDFYLEAGADGLTVLGMMGEAPKLTGTESRQVIQRVIARAQGKPVVVGVSSPGLAALAEVSHEAMAQGAAGVMIAPPMSLRTDAQILNYYRQACGFLGSDVPVVLQDFPLATTVQISDELLGHLIDDLPQIVMLKHEDWPGLSKISKLRGAEKKGRRRISVLCGNGGVFLPEEVARGADGAMTGFGFPEMLVQVTDLAGRGEMDRAQDLFDAYLPLVRYEQQPGVGLAVRKYVLAKRGAIASAAQRQPGAKLDALAQAEVERLLRRQEKRLAELG
ncbi:2-dehydro-3-deoxy-L-arabinonate dehydratase [Neorhizobium galegae bv. officinalis bv. officinalis str. HAMBI 1141]|uniref:2-dehydro-3-deoxy-L-arabinonate dehydratase n=1 Tax=Neorhizobium galegae bv. officinalis bv. officinalis str. HAMBI 1141 TaxID=1028801 RepID=A0A068TG42_NEOGA|nr:dihydrodipicolinate synthase family protein [Neorhizobium galegae]CDN56370.1 2-dehydro-3-deoxy-L-arabinonate dehydratase [Neorhizobium galegae bv. officinalis bv. officinalis str. HAMBI 1141]